jgi:hypothetical protein
VSKQEDGAMALPVRRANALHLRVARNAKGRGLGVSAQRETAKTQEAQTRLATVKRP